MVPIPWALLPGFLVELVLYFGLGTRWFSRLNTRHLPLLIWIAALLPFAVLPGDHARWWQLAALAAVPSLWFCVVPRSRWFDLLFLTIMAGVYASPLLGDFYPDKAEILGRVMWVRCGIAAVVGIAKEPGIGFGFIPSRRDWIVGAKNFALFIPVAAVVGFVVSYWRVPANYELKTAVLRALGMFVGQMVFVAVAEEFFFRGLLQRWTNIGIASAMFGVVHIGFRQFPNWKFMAMAAAAGVFYGRAFRESGSLRGAIVAHALTVTAWVLVLGKV